MTKRVWNLDQPRRSSRAGIKLRMGESLVPFGCTDVSTVVVITSSVHTDVDDHVPTQNCGVIAVPIELRIKTHPVLGVACDV
jgi:hypothetical protein